MSESKVKMIPIPVDDIESLSREELSRRFLKVVFSGWLCGNVPVADSVTYLSLTEQMRREAKQQLAQLEEQIQNEAWPESTKVALKVMLDLSGQMKAS